MSRGSREPITGILKGSMRDNYSEHGVGEYYKKVGATYRNPHFPGIRSCIFLWLNRWWQMERQKSPSDPWIAFDMACGSGEATLSILEWWQLGRISYEQEQKDTELNPSPNDAGAIRPRRPKVKSVTPPPLDSTAPRPVVIATDPYTADAYHSRTALQCASLCFKDIAEGSFPSLPPSLQTSDEPSKLDMVVCSFALHLVESPSELFALLWELSTKARWLIIIAPHKKPDIKDGWGWCKWDVDAWQESRISDSQGEFLQERVHCRVYRSLNI
ncbi:hypothetical protein OBBRIDRAFT_825085 [Obba rivulosa]|uniref:Uncharacterized protein n=1 Tax=Obba rivulosa TaxID=1052685 RepID=A0A8E2AVT3_9APHY|nr:hypothetical protein OBBRIDRAFT_825085 [Obba rivulosa]